METMVRFDMRGAGFRGAVAELAWERLRLYFEQVLPAYREQAELLASA